MGGGKDTRGEKWKQLYGRKDKRRMIAEKKTMLKENERKKEWKWKK